MPMQGSIVVDTNAGETALFQALVRRFDASTVTRRKLDVGDVMLVADAGTVYVERKTWLDWAKSLSDGRYANQKARLLAAARGGDGGSDAADDDEGEAAPATTTTSTTAVLYLVEGALTGWSGKVAGGGVGMGPVSKMTNAQLEAAVVMTAVRDGVPVLRSKDGVCGPHLPPPPNAPRSPAHDRRALARAAGLPLPQAARRRAAAVGRRGDGGVLLWLRGAPCEEAAARQPDPGDHVASDARAGLGHVGAQGGGGGGGLPDDERAVGGVRGGARGRHGAARVGVDLVDGERRRRRRDGEEAAAARPAGGKAPRAALRRHTSPRRAWPRAAAADR